VANRHQKIFKTNENSTEVQSTLGSGRRNLDKCISWPLNAGNTCLAFYTGVKTVALWQSFRPYFGTLGRR